MVRSKQPMSHRMEELEPIDWARWMRALGRQNRCVREFLGLSQAQLAKLAGVSQGAISRFESGRGMSTPVLIVTKIYLAIARELRALDPAILRDDVRRLLQIGPPLAEDLDWHEAARMTDSDLLELVRLYHALPEGQRQALLAAMRAALDSLGAAPQPLTIG